MHVKVIATTKNTFHINIAEKFYSLNIFQKWVSIKKKFEFYFKPKIIILIFKSPNNNKGKPRGLRTARKLKDHRRDQRWHDKQYKKSHLGTRWRSNPFSGASHAKGIVLEKM